MPIDPKRPIAAPPASRRPAAPAASPSPASERGPGFVWILAPQPGRIRAVPVAAGGVLGRGEEASLRVDAPGVAPSHAKVELVSKGAGLPNEIYVTDNGTPSGTYVSGMRASRTVLAEGDLLRVGSAIALVVDRDVGTYEGAVIEEGGIIRGPRSRRTWWAAFERAAGEPREGRRVAIIAGSPGTGRRAIARRIGEAWGVSVFGDESRPSAHEVDASGNEDLEQSVAAAANKGCVIVRGLERASDARRGALLRALDKRKTVPMIAIVDDATWAVPADLEPLFGSHRIDLPSIEQRREEIPSIIRHRFEKKGVVGNRLSIELYEAMTRAAWPGEIEEIVDCVDRIATSHTEVPRLGPEHLVRPLARRGGRVQPKPRANDPQSEADRIRAALVEAKGSVAAAARALHLSRQALYREAARLGIDIRRTREDGNAAE
jgi:hypothetical protein